MLKHWYGFSYAFRSCAALATASQARLLKYEQVMLQQRKDDLCNAFMDSPFKHKSLLHWYMGGILQNLATTSCCLSHLHLTDTNITAKILAHARAPPHDPVVYVRARYQKFAYDLIINLRRTTTQRDHHV